MKGWLRALLFICSFGFGVAGLADQSSRRSDAELFSVAVSAVKNAPKIGHPRLLKGQQDFAGIIAAISSERALGFKAMADYLRRNPINNVNLRVSGSAGQTMGLEDLTNWFKEERMLEGMAEAGFAWYATKDSWYVDELRARLKYFGARVLDNQCQGDLIQSRAYAWYFALAYDFAFQVLEPHEISLVHDVIRACAKKSLIATSGKITKNPRDGVTYHALGKFVGSLLIMLDDMPEAREWLFPALQAYLVNLSPWGGEDGGYANGTSYALWDVGESLLVWDLIDRVVGVPVYAKPWVAELPKFITYTLPPGAPAGLFGDGAEVNRKEEWARIGKSIMNRVEYPIARWYLKQLSGEDFARLHILLSPREFSGSAEWPVNVNNSATFESVGWAAMHSDLTDRNRVSVYFKSSPYGSLNHSHADQNSFVIYAHDKVIAMDSGIYDYYNSPHWRQWYKQTRAHNAITYDGGKGQFLGGQGLGSKHHNGKITESISTPEYDLVQGDATMAYAGDIKSAKRWVAFIRPKTIVVIDKLRAGKEKSWEWNLHTTAPATEKNELLDFSIQGTRTCVHVKSPSDITYSVSEGYQPPPNSRNIASEHYWHRFVYNQPNVEGVFVSVIEIDCDRDDPDVRWNGKDWSVSVGGTQISLTDSGVFIH